MTHKQFEKQIADKLNQYEVQPDEGLLDSIFEKRAIKRKPLRLTRLFFAAAIMTITISTLYVYYEHGNGHSIAFKHEQNNENKQADISGPSVRLEESHMAQSKVEALQDESVSKSVSGKANHKVSLYKNRRAILKSESMDIQSASTGNSQSSFIGKNIKQGIKTGYAIDNGANISNRFFDVNSKNRPTIDRTEHKGKSHLYVYNSVNEELLDANTYFFIRLKPLKKFVTSYPFENVNKIANHPVDAKSLSGAGRKPIFIDLLYVPILTSTDANGNPEVENYVNLINRNSYNSQYGVRISFPIGERISIFSGLFYQHQTNAFKGNITKSEEVTRTNAIITYINDPVNGTVKVTTYQTVTGMEDKKTAYNFKNTYKLFQLPIGFSYNFGFKKFDFALNTSALINLFSNSNGRSMDMEHNSTDGFASSSKYLGFGAGLSVMAAMKVSPRFKLIFEPGLQRFNINSIKVGNNINEKVFNKQFTLGLRYTVF